MASPDNSSIPGNRSVTIGLGDTLSVGAERSTVVRPSFPQRTQRPSGDRAKP